MTSVAKRPGTPSPARGGALVAPSAPPPSDFHHMTVFVPEWGVLVSGRARLASLRPRDRRTPEEQMRAARLRLRVVEQTTTERELNVKLVIEEDGR